MRAMVPGLRFPRPVLAACVLFGAALSAQTPAPSADPGADLVRQAQQKQRDGKPGEAVALYRQALQASPRSFAAHQQLGNLLDLAGEYGRRA